MRNFKYLFVLILSISLLFSFQSCSDNLELEPFTALDASTGFKTKQDVEAALLGCYSSLQSGNYYGLRFWALSDIYAGTLTHTGTFPSFAQFANRQLLANNVEITNMWNTIYAGINRANNVITSAANLNDPSYDSNNAIGEARLLRGFHYFNLITLFGGSPGGFNQGGAGVPLVLTPTLTPADAAPKARATEAEVWIQIFEDVNFALTNLKETNGIGRVNKLVANALKARIHLVRGEWADAEASATTVISSGRYTLLSGANYANIYLSKNSTETIWELQFDANNTNSIAFFYYPAANGGRNEMSSSASLRDLHEAADLRKAVNVTTSVPVNKTLKFTRVAGEDNVQIIRFSEMYLIRAEARARQSKADVALEDLNIVRKRAGLADFTDQDVTSIISAVLKERVIEFAHEGHRWVDIRRTGGLALAGISQPFRGLWPIPEREVDTSSKVIAQNEGY